MSLVDLAKVKRYIGIAVSDTSDDTLLADLAADFDDTAVQILNGRVFGPASYVQQFDGTGTPELLLPHYPIDVVSEVKIDANLGFGAEILAEVEDEDFTINAAAGILLRLTDVWPEGAQNVKVSWNVAAAIPAGIYHAANITLADAYTRAKQLAGGQSGNEMVSETISGGRAETYKSELDPRWGIPITAVQRLMRYRNPV